MRRPRLSLCLPLIALLGSQAPAIGKTPEGEASGEVAVALDRVIGTQGDLGRGGFLRRLTGRGDLPLFSRPFGVAWDGDDLLVTDPGAGQVLSVRRRGRIRQSPENLFESPIGIAVCPQGIVVSDSATGRVALLDRELSLERWLAEGIERPTGVACRGERIFVVETGRHRVLSLDAESRAPAARSAVARPEPDLILGGRGAGEGELNFPTTVALDRGSLWVGDTLNFRLQRFDPATGGFAGSFGRLGDATGEMPRIKGMAIDAGGRLWVTDAYLDQVAVYSADGAFLLSLGNRGSRPGEFSFPAGIAIHPDGLVAVADSLNRRLQILRLTATESAEGAR